MPIHRRAGGEIGTFGLGSRLLWLLNQYCANALIGFDYR